MLDVRDRDACRAGTNHRGDLRDVALTYGHRLHILYEHLLHLFGRTFTRLDFYEQTRSIHVGQ